MCQSMTYTLSQLYNFPENSARWTLAHTSWCTVHRLCRHVHIVWPNDNIQSHLIVTITFYMFRFKKANRMHFLQIVHKCHICVRKELWLHFCHSPHTSSQCIDRLHYWVSVSASGFMSASNCRAEPSRRHKSCIFAGRLIQHEASHRTESIDAQRGVRSCFINHNAGSSVQQHWHLL